MRPIIQVKSLGKKYLLAPRETVAPTLREALRDSLQNKTHALMRRNGSRHPTVWALRDINFEVYPGEVIGIVGPNGAGKSTLLKILARITSPTTGEAHLYGQTGALLGVGTGFHPDLTGRENIYLNGAILGMNRNEIARKFDEIVAFAEIEGVLDTPTKRYSSGMYLRLGFAIAAHLEPEILLLDEVLTVGDARFRSRCLKKIKEAGKNGTTVLFVSHNVDSVNELCGRTLHIDAGRIQAEGKTQTVIEHYLKGVADAER